MNRKKLGLLCGWGSIIINIVLFGLKLWVGLLVNSIAMVADAWHTLSDSVSSVIVVAGFHISGKSPDSRHPYGHGRIESIAAIVIAVLLFVVGVNFLKEAIIKTGSGKTLNISGLAITVFIISAVIKEIIARITLWAGKKTGSELLKADGWHHRSDAVTTLVIIAGFFFCGKYPWLDGVLGIFISLFIIYTAYDIIRDSSETILGRKMPEDIMEGIEGIIKNQYPEIREAHHFHLHSYGEHKELTFHVYMPGNMPLDAVHGIVDKLEKQIYETFRLNATVHPDYSPTKF